MIDPTSGGKTTLPELRKKLLETRQELDTYARMDAETGGMRSIMEKVIQLERALMAFRYDHDAEAATWEFLHRNHAVQFENNRPYWDFFELIDGKWRITRWEIAVELKKPVIRTLDVNND